MLYLSLPRKTCIRLRERLWKSNIRTSGSGVHLFTHRVRDAERVSGGGRPPHHQVGEAGDPEDAAQEGDRKQFASCNDENYIIISSINITSLLLVIETK